MNRKCTVKGPSSTGAFTLIKVIKMELVFRVNPIPVHNLLSVRRMHL